MFARLILLDEPNKPQREEVVDLEPGYLGDSLKSAINELSANQLKEPPVAQLAEILEVICEKSTLLSHEDETVLFGKDVVPEGYYVTVPTLRLRCRWATQEESQIIKAYETIPQKFSSKPVRKPVILCPSQTQLVKKEEPQPSLIAEKKKEEQEKEKKRKRLKVYFTSALPEGFKGGDSEYISALVRGLKRLGVEATRVIGETELGKEETRLASSGELTMLNYSVDTFKKLDFQIGELMERAAAQTLDLMLKEQEEDLLQILHITSRHPSSGNAFGPYLSKEKTQSVGMGEEDARRIKIFQDNGFPVVVTCHEFKFNLRNASSAIHNAATLNVYCNQADKVVFLNSHDLRNACRAAEAGVVKMSSHSSARGASDFSQPVKCPNLSGKVNHIPVPILLNCSDISVEEVLKRPPNILIFGVVRERKGFEDCVELAKQIRQKYLPWRVKLCGRVPNGDRTIIDIILNTYGGSIINQALSLGYEGNEIKLKELVKVFLETKILGFVHKSNEISREDALNERVKNIIAECDSLRDKLTFEWLQNREKYSENKTDWDKQIAERGEQIKEFAKTSAKTTQERETKKVELERLKLDLDDFKFKLGAVPSPCLPVDIHVSVSPSELEEIARQCKYSFKQDEKGMADNASSIISGIAYGCITFTSCGDDTPHEFRSDKKVVTGEVYEKKRSYKDESVGTGVEVENGKFEFNYNGKYKDAVLLPASKKKCWTPVQVLNEISKREESDDQEINRRTVEAMKSVTEHRFNPDIVAVEHMLLYRSFMK